MACTLYFVRHGETALCGRRLAGPDEPLSPRGRTQALGAAAELARRRVRLVVSSDMRRARETAEAIAGALGLPLELDERLRERAVGEEAGRELAPIAPACWHDLDWAPSGGESLRRQAERVGEALEGLVERAAAGPVAVVAHGGTIRIARALAAGSLERIDFGPPRIAHASVHRVDVSPR
jgi:glucosyl-3-phosphoglycerate phosphatase